MTAVAPAPAAPALADGSTLTVMTKPSCVQCNATYRQLDKVGLSYDSVDMSQDLEALELARSLGYMQAPVVIVRDAAGEVVDRWSGFDPDKIKGIAEAQAVAA